MGHSHFWVPVRGILANKMLTKFGQNGQLPLLDLVSKWLKASTASKARLGPVFEISTCLLVRNNQNNQRASKNERGICPMDKQEAMPHKLLFSRKEINFFSIDFNITKSTHDEKNYGNSTVNRWMNKSICCNETFFALYFGFINLLFPNLLITPDKEINFRIVSRKFTCLSSGQVHLFS